MSSFKYYNHNVKMVFIFSILQSIGRGIWQGSVLSAYIFYIAHESNTLLGLTSAAQGVTMTLIVFPAGFIADKYRRDNLLKVSAFLALISAGIMAFAQDLVMIVVGLAFWGLAQGTNRPANESLLADSIQSGNRSKIYSRLHFIRNVASAVGPILNILLFSILGDEWDLKILRTVMIFGITVSAASVYAITQMSDDYAIKDSESIYQKELKNGKSLRKSAMMIPIVIVGSNLLVGSAAGMSIKFFPIFFIEIYKLNPISVQIILGLTQVATGLTAIVSQKLSQKSGRVQMIIIGQLLATLCLFIISLYPDLILMAIIFVLRGSLMNASQPLSRSIIMDVIPKHNRGKINSIETLAWGMFWNASAAIGGFLVDARGFSFTFQITASVYLLATIPLALIIPLVKNEMNVQK